MSRTTLHAPLRMVRPVGLTASGLNGNLAGAARLRDISIELTDEGPTIVIAPEERPRRALLKLLSSACSLTSGRLVFRDGEEEIDLTESCARDLAAVRNRRIACSATMPAPHPALTCAQAVAELAQCSVEDAEAELAALGHGHAVGQKVGDTRGADRSVLPVAAVLLHPARVLLLDLANHSSPEVRHRVELRTRRGAAVLMATDALYDALPANARTHLLTSDGHLI